MGTKKRRTKAESERYLKKEANTRVIDDKEFMAGLKGLAKKRGELKEYNTWLKEKRAKAKKSDAAKKIKKTPKKIKKTPKK